MLFVTETFLLFFCVVLLVYWLLPYRFRVDFLIVTSVFFYASWSRAFAVHFLVVIIINYYVMEIWRLKRKVWIFAILQIANISNIAFFKYYYFLADVIGKILFLPEWQSPFLRAYHKSIGSEIMLPLAISFYTFQIMSYGIDIYRNVYSEKHSLREVVLFKIFFPQLIAGPIMRSSDLLPQIQSCDRGEIHPDRKQMMLGMWLILSGIVKKVAIADFLLVTLAPVLSSSGDRLADYAPEHIWIAMLGLMFMLYADFSAYSDLARGFGAMLGFSIPENFHAPFFMKSISDFWRRWHLTFSYWIRDYIFIPLGGNRVQEWREYLNLIITFSIGGLWHGASYTFLIWGTATGLMISIESFLFKRYMKEWPDSYWKRGLKLAATWIVFVPTAPFFFGPNASWSFHALGRMFDLFSFGERHSAGFHETEAVMYSVIAVLIFHVIEEKPGILTPLRRFEKFLLPVCGFLAMMILIQFGGGAKDFFYFQF